MKKLLITLIAILSLNACVDATSKEVVTENKPEFRISYTKDISEITYCLGMLFDGFVHGIGVPTTYKVLIAPSGKEGRFSLIRNAQMPLAVYEFKNNEVLLYPAKGAFAKYVVNSSKTRDMLVNQSKQCIS